MKSVMPTSLQAISPKSTPDIGFAVFSGARTTAASRV
jgi:hypothetical protein